MMYKSLLIFFLALAQMSVAQEDEQRKFSIGIAGGVAFPLGDFKKTNEFEGRGFSNEIHYSGFASTGYSVPEIYLNYVSNKHFGISIKYFKSFFPLNDTKFIGNSGLSYDPNNPIKMEGLVIGPSINTSSGNFHFELRLMAGVSWAKYSEIIETGNTPSYAFSLHTYGKSKAFTIDAGININYYFSKRIAVFFGIDFIISKHELFHDNYLTEVYNVGFNISTPVLSYHDETTLTYQFIKPSLGISFKL